MKAINNFIIEHLKYSTFPISEKLKISSKSKFYSCQPKDKYELRKILEERLAEDKDANLNDIDVSQIIDMGHVGFPVYEGLFTGLDPRNIKLEYWDVSNVIDMSLMFRDCKNFNCDLSNWNVSNVTNMQFMFSECKNFTGKGLEYWDVSKVKDMSFMFWGCKKFNCDLNNWDVSKVKHLMEIFRKCDSLINKPSWY